MTKLCLLFGLVLSSGASQASWEQGLALLEQGKAAEAVESWSVLASSPAHSSPQLHHNLALAHSQLGNWDRASYHLALSARLRRDPLYGWTALKNLSLLQQRLFVPKDLSQDFLFRLPILLHTGFFLWFASIAGWTAAFGFLFKKPRMTLTACVGTVVFSGFFAASFFSPRFGVVVADSEVSVWTDPHQQEKKLVGLSPGTLVRVGSTEDGFEKILSPVVGWIAGSSIARLP